MTYPDKRVYRYSVAADGQSIEVEHAGVVQMNLDDDSYESKAKGLVVSTQLIPESDFEVKKVDSIPNGVITSVETPNKRK